MGHYAGYSKQDYPALLEVLSGVSGKFLLAIYPSELLDEYVEKSGWTKRDIPMPLSAGSKGRRKVEVLVSDF